MQNKEQTINAIYARYFDIIDSYFGGIKHYLGKDEESHIDLGSKIANYPLVSDLILDATEDIIDKIDSFWRENINFLLKFIREQKILKCLYSGKITPSILENFIKRSAFYIDTVIIPDPVLNLALFKDQIYSDKKYYLYNLVKNVFNIWKIKDLVLANTKNKIAIIMPINLMTLPDKEKNKLLDNSAQKYIDFINKIFDKDFLNIETALDFFKQLKTNEDLFNNLKNIEILPNIFKNSKSLEDFLVNFKDNSTRSELSLKTMGEAFGFYINSQFVRVQEHKHFCNLLHSEPIYDYELPWFFFTYEEGGVDMDAAIANALQKEKFEWISKIPISAIKVLREQNELEYMRSTLRRGITDLKAREDINLIEVSESIEKNLKDAFNRQKTELTRLKKEVKKISFKEIPITTGGSLAGFIPVIGNIISLPFAGRDIKKLINERNGLKTEIVALESNFINLLIKNYG